MATLRNKSGYGPVPTALDMRPCLRENCPQDLLDLIEMLLRAGQRRRELDHRIAAIVGAADQPGVEQGVRQEAAEEPFGLVVVECLAGGLVLDHLDAVEI